LEQLVVLFLEVDFLGDFSITFSTFNSLDYPVFLFSLFFSFILISSFKDVFLSEFTLFYDDIFLSFLGEFYEISSTILFL